MVSILTERERISHLFRRAGFGLVPTELAAWTAEGLEAAVASLLAAPAEPEEIAPPEWAKQPFDPAKLIDQQACWIHRMVTTHYPLAEKMTLFWHGHFATGARKVGRPDWMVGQIDLLRRHALGHFPTLLREVGRDPAMLIWLDGHGSQKKAPNENYAREVMELFTTGPGPYTEQDIQEAARAFTGWRANRETGEVQFIKIRHDGGVKTFLGKSGRFGADDIADLLSARPETAKFLSTKLWRFFASPVPDEATISAMAEAYTSRGGQIQPMLRTLFQADAFYADGVRGALVRSPADLVASTLRVLGFPVARDAAIGTARMGQVLFEPPNVSGWPGGVVWLGASTLLNRWNLGEAIKLRMGQKPQARLLLNASDPAGLVSAWLDRLHVPAVSTTTRAALLKLVGDKLPSQPRAYWELTRDLVRTIVAAPEYQSI